MTENVNSNSQLAYTTNRIQWRIRPGTQDLHILSEVYENNCYRLPDRLPENTVVIDIGANIGTFSGLCLERGATAVYAYEPDKDNFGVMNGNLFSFTYRSRPCKAHTFNAAVVGDDNLRPTIPFPVSYHLTADGAQSTGGKNIFDSGTGLTVNVQCARITDVISCVVSEWPNCDIWLKLDCEGSEHQILDSLLTVERGDYTLDWKHVTRIFGEAHATHDGFDPDIAGPRDWSNIQRTLLAAGYHVHIDGSGPFRLFFAQKRPLPLLDCVGVSGLVQSTLEPKNRQPRILIVGDACYSTGFAACTHTLADHLHANAWSVHILGINHYGDPHTYPYTVHPSHSPLNMASDNYGVERLPGLINEIKPDLVIILQDPWNIRQYLESIRESGLYPVPPIIGWLAVDSRNQKTAEECNGLYSVIAWTEFGKRELISGGYRGPVHIVPLGVDTSIFRPLDKVESRRQIFDSSLGAGVVGPDDYIVGVVGRNQHRKRIDLAIEYFAEWVRDVGDTDRKIWLYLHISPTGEVGCDIGSMIKYHGLTGRVLINAPAVGTGLSPDLMPAMYSSLDCLLSTSQAEGWNLPALEAMACGIPCVLPDSGGHDWASETAIMIPCMSNVLSAPINNRRAGMHTIGAVVSKKETIDALQALYSSKNMRAIVGQTGIQLAEELTWQAMAVSVESILRGYLPVEFRASSTYRPTHTDLMISPETIAAMEMPDTSPLMVRAESEGIR